MQGPVQDAPERRQRRARREPREPRVGGDDLQAGLREILREYKRRKRMARRLLEEAETEASVVITDVVRSSAHLTFCGVVEYYVVLHANITIVQAVLNRYVGWIPPDRPDLVYDDQDDVDLMMMVLMWFFVVVLTASTSEHDIVYFVSSHCILFVFTCVATLVLGTLLHVITWCFWSILHAVGYGVYVAVLDPLYTIFLYVLRFVVAIGSIGGIVWLIVRAYADGRPRRARNGSLWGRLLDVLVDMALAFFCRRARWGY